MSIPERILWIVGGAVLDYASQIYHLTFKTRWGFLYVALLAAVVLILCLSR